MNAWSCSTSAATSPRPSPPSWTASPGRILGVVEDTENGHKRYADLDKLPCPVVSVARSPLKDPEDFLVGQSVVFSTEALMRSRGDILHGRPALVIGFGKLGSSIARLLHAKGVQVTVYDIDPIRRTQALSQGFTVARDRDTALHNAGLVLCATGAISLRQRGLLGAAQRRLRRHRHRQSEDELDLATRPTVYQRTRDGEHITRYRPRATTSTCSTAATPSTSCTARSVGPFIFLVQAEILAAIRMLTRGDLTGGIHEVSAADRAVIADTWLTYFNR